MSTIPDTQRAWRVVQRGHPKKALRLRDDVPVLSDLKDGEVLVKIKSAALNPIGYKLMKTMPNFMAKRPRTAEYDFSGVVVKENNSGYTIGDEVYGWVPAAPNFPNHGQGALASYIAHHSRYIAKKPASMSFDESAGLGLTGLTALYGFDIGNLQDGQTIFINGGTSSVGIMAIQIAKTRGCEVTASCSAKNIGFVKNLGADEVIDYRANPPHLYLREHPPAKPFDMIFDTIGTSNDIYLNSEAYLKPGGSYITIGSGFDKISLSTLPRTAVEIFRVFLQPAWLGGVNRRWVFYLQLKEGKYVPELAKAVSSGKLKPTIDSVHEFEEVLSAYERIMTGRAVGKVVVHVS
ncbi:hypothetical protein FRC02_010644 [Tulasnella sp. 418]|nr:hypothetical protein FRC02_010644 [Tulasnella sp. 418]